MVTVLLLLCSLPLAPVAAAQGGANVVNVSRSRGASTSPGCAVDAADRIHLAWADNPDSDEATEQFVFYARSSDGGVTFETPRRVSIGVDSGTRPREIRVVATAAGEVAIAWWATVVETDSRVFLTAFFVRSSDGGETFRPALETSLRFRDAAAKEGFANTTSLSLAAGPDDTFGLLATVPDYYHGFNVYFARTVDGETFSEPKRVTNYSVTIPRAAANALAYLSNGDVYATWTESRGDFVDEIKDVFYVVSNDGGRTFSAPAQLAHVRGIVGAVVVTSNATALLAQSQKNENAPAIVKLFRSTNGGRTYGSRARVARSASYGHLHQNSVSTNASRLVAIAWTENSSRSGPTDGLYVAVSRDGGKSFDEPRLVEPGLFIDPPSVAVDSAGRVGVAFSSSDAALEDREVLFLRVSP